MKYILLLSKENLDLAKEEVLAVINPKKYTLLDNLLILETNMNDFKRLAYTNKIYKLLFLCKENYFIKNLEAFDWQKVYKKNFCLRIHKKSNNPYNEAELAGYVWDKLKNPKVNLEKPKTLIECFFAQNNIVCGLLLEKIKHRFEQRRAHLRPVLQPVSLHPRLARALINLTGIKKGTILDPFCGTGGILIEAALIGMSGVGYDINSYMLKACEKNLKKYKIKDCKLEKQDAVKIKQKFDYVVTDLPYGKNTKKTDLEKLYLDFLKNLRKILKKMAVVVFPASINYKKMIKQSKLKIKKEFSYYIHKTMTKKIVVLG